MPLEGIGGGLAETAELGRGNPALGCTRACQAEGPGQKNELVLGDLGERLYPFCRHQERELISRKSSM
jgi:hypothetical protein